MDEPVPQLQAAMMAISRYFVGDQSLADTLSAVALAARDAVRPADEVGITMMVDRKPATAIFTDPEMPEIDAAQYVTGDGPCIQSFRDGARYRIESTREPGRWQPFRDVAADHGIGSTLSLPMIAHDVSAGAMNFYARTEHAFADADMSAAELFASQAAFVLVNARAYWDSYNLSENLRTAMQSRATIEQAKGIIMSTMRCSPNEAMKILVQQSRSQNIKLRQIAAEIVANAQRRG